MNSTFKNTVRSATILCFATVSLSCATLLDSRLFAGELQLDFPRGNRDIHATEFLNTIDREGVSSGLTNPALAIGLNPISDWSTQMPFINIFKQARPWIGFLKNSDKWGGIEFNNLKTHGYLDEHGWPKTIPPQLKFLRSILDWDFVDATSTRKGRYTLSYHGEGNLRVSGFGNYLKVIDTLPGKIEFDYSGNGAILIDILQTDTNGNGNYVRNISLVRNDRLWLHNLGFFFNPDWIDKIKDLRVLRFMNWMLPNGSEQSTWSERPKLSDAFWEKKGVPLEVMVELSNFVGADPWFTIPHLATNKYIENFAIYLKKYLDPKLKIYLEYSNEVWNWQFEQAQWAHKQASRRWPEAEGSWLQFYALKATMMVQIFDNIFTTVGHNRIIRILSTQTGWPGLEKFILKAPLWISENPEINQAPYLYFDAYAITGYFDGGLSGNEKKSKKIYNLIKKHDQEIKKLSNTRTFSNKSVLYQSLINELRNGSTTGVEDGSLVSLAKLFKYHSNIAQAHNLKLIMYEGGTHVVGIGKDVENSDYTNLFIAINNSKKMGELYDELINNWHSSGGLLFNAFVDVGRHTKWGSWGAIQHLDDITSRWQSLMKYNRTQQTKWESRSITDFTHGVITFGTNSNDLLKGTSESDLLGGGGGNDIIVGGPGNDKIHGGSGIDTVYFSGNYIDYAITKNNNLTIVKNSNHEIHLVEIEYIYFPEQKKCLPVSDGFHCENFFRAQN